MSQQRYFFGPGQRMGGMAKPQAGQPQQQAPANAQGPGSAAPPTARGPASVAPRVTAEPAREVSLPPTAAIVDGLAAPDDHRWPNVTPEETEAFIRDNPGLARQMADILLGLGKRAISWGEVLGFSDLDILDMGQATFTPVLQGRFQQAEDAFGALCDVCPFVPLFWLGYADVFEEQGKMPEAVAAYGVCIGGAERVNPPLLEALLSRLHRGAVQFRSEAPLEAAQEFLYVLQRDPEPAGERAMTAGMALQVLLNLSKITPDILTKDPRGAIGNGWTCESGRVAYAGGGAEESRAGAATGGRLFASSHSSQTLSSNAARLRGETNSHRTSMKFPNLVRPHYKRSIARAAAEGQLPVVERPGPDKARERLLGVLAKRRPEELRAVYHRLKLEMSREGRLTAEEASELTRKSRRLVVELRQFYKQRAAAAALDKSYRNAHTVDMRATRAMGRGPSGSPGAPSSGMPGSTPSGMPPGRR